MKLIQNVSWIFIANVIVSFSKWLILVFIVKLLTPEDVGAYSLAFAVSAPITLFANMKLRSLYVTDEKPYFSDYIISRNILSLFSLITLFVLSFFVYPEYLLIIIFVGLTKILDLQSDIYYALPHKDSSMDTLGKLMIIKHILIIICFLLTLFINRNLMFSLIAQIITQVIYFFLFEKRIIESNFKYTKRKYSTINIFNVLRTGIPLGVVQLITSLNANIPRYFLEFFESAKVLGYYSATAYVVAIGNTLMSAISQSFLPVLNKKIKSGNFSSFRKIIYLISSASLLFGLCFVLFSVLFGKEFLMIMYNESYAEYNDLLIIMSISITINFVSWIYDAALLSMRYINVQPKISIFILFINIFASYYLIKIFGIYGASYTLIILNSFQLLLRFYFVKKKLNQLVKDNN